MGHASGSHTHTHVPGGVGKYVAVFVALCVLTAISFAVGNSQQLRENAPGVMMAMMMAVSCAKASLVILFFMHLKYEANWKYVLTIPASIMSFFLVLMLIPDIARRTNYYTEERWLYAAEEQTHHAGEHHDEEHAGGEHGASEHDHKSEAHDAAKPATETPATDAPAEAAEAKP